MFSRTFLLPLLAPTLLLSGGVGAYDAQEAITDPAFGEIPEAASCNQFNKEFIECFRTHMAVGRVSEYEKNWQTLV